MKMRFGNNINGVTLMELLVAIPMFAVVTLSIVYTLFAHSQLSVTQIARFKVQMAANNLLTMVKASAISEETPALKIIAGQTLSDQTEFVSQSGSVVSSLKSDSPLHPDVGGTKINVNARWEVSDSTFDTGPEPVFIIETYAPDFQVGCQIKTYFVH